jgi:hypothetical protein
MPRGKVFLLSRAAREQMAARWGVGYSTQNYVQFNNLERYIESIRGKGLVEGGDYLMEVDML